MIRDLRAYFIRKRFERFFVKPYVALAEQARDRHAKGAKAAFEAQRQAVLRALEGAVRG
jgi:hypothetical protein